MESIPEEETTDVQASRPRSEASPRFMPSLALWTVLTVVTLGGHWVAGFRTRGLIEAVDRGAARVESFRVGELNDDVIRKTIQTQRDTLPFWTLLALLGDFLVEPAALAARALAAATAFAAIAALRGRPIEYERALAECSAAQGFWVAGIFVRAVLMVALRRDDTETSAALLLAPGLYPAYLDLALRQLDVFAVIGWSTMASGAVRRGQVRWPGALFVTLMLAGFEAAARVCVATILGAGMRLSVLPS
jgi:hypothetical protein